MKTKWQNFLTTIRKELPNPTDLILLPHSILRGAPNPETYSDSNREFLNKKLDDPEVTSFDRLTIRPVNNFLATEGRKLEDKALNEIVKGMGQTSTMLEQHPTTFFKEYGQQQFAIGSAFAESNESAGNILHCALGFSSLVLAGLSNPVEAKKSYLGLD